MSSTSNFSDSNQPQTSAKRETNGKVSPMDVKIGAASVSLPLKTPPIQEACKLHGATPELHHPQVIMTQYAAQQVQAHATSDTTVELGGVLLGHAYVHNNSTFVQVEAAIPAVSDDNGPIHFTFTGDSWSQIHRDKAEHYPDLDIIGWFHTHPDLGVFYSADDEVVHSAAFTQPWHVGLVVDPIRNEASYFGWDEGLLLPIDGFFELIPPDAAPDDVVPRTVIGWAVVIDSSWTTADSMSSMMPENQFADRTISILRRLERNSELALFLGGFAAALTVFNLAVLFFVLWRYF